MKIIATALLAVLLLAGCADDAKQGLSRTVVRQSGPHAKALSDADMDTAAQKICDYQAKAVKQAQDATAGTGSVDDANQLYQDMVADPALADMTKAEIGAVALYARKWTC